MPEFGPIEMMACADGCIPEILGILAGQGTKQALGWWMWQHLPNGLRFWRALIHVGDDGIIACEKTRMRRKGRMAYFEGWSKLAEETAGMTVKGGPDKVLVRGHVVFENGHVVGTPGWGRFVPRQ